MSQDAGNRTRGGLFGLLSHRTDHHLARGDGIVLWPRAMTFEKVGQLRDVIEFRCPTEEKNSGLHTLECALIYGLKTGCDIGIS